jgi:hypothetical protein
MNPFIKTLLQAMGLMPGRSFAGIPTSYGTLSEIEQLLTAILGGVQRGQRTFGNTLGGRDRGGVRGIVAEVLRRAGYSVTDTGVVLPPSGRMGSPPPLPRRTTPPPKPPKKPPSAVPPQPPQGEPPGGKPSPTGKSRLKPQQPAKPGEEAEYAEEILTPQSSNVYSFSYYRASGDKLGTLYVTFKASKLNPDGLRHVKGHGGRQQLRGTLGSTHSGGKSNEPGSQYGYYRVPPAIFTRMKAAVSKGKFVWDALRIRGTIYGHQYAYSLVQGQIVTGGKSGLYVPRRATQEGFRSRSLADAGTGRRGFTVSTLPATKFPDRLTRKPRGGR